MNTRRWLLPFTWGVDMQAIDSVVCLAESAGVTLVAASLISAQDKLRSRGPRLEHIQQSKDFLEAVKWKASRYQVPIECHEIYTTDVLRSIAMLVHDLSCDSMILVSGGKDETLLHTHELKHLLVKPPASFMLLRLAKPIEQPSPRIPFLLWLRKLLGQLPSLPDEARAVQDKPEVNYPLATRTEEYRKG